MTDIQIIVVKRPHSWLVKRDEPRARVCKTCGKRADQLASMVCYEEEVEREAPQAGNE